MGYDALPVEVLSEIFDYVSDVYSFMSLAATCRIFQEIIRGKVLVVTDSPHVSGFFDSIATKKLVMAHPTDLEAYTGIIHLYTYFIVEFSRRHSHEKSALANDYILNVVYNKRYQWQRVTRVLLTQDSMSMLSRLSFSDHPRVHQHTGQQYVQYLESQLMHVHRTLCLHNRGKIDATFGSERSQLEVMGHEYDFFNVERLPRLYFHVNKLYDFFINSKTLEVLNGIVNTSMTLPRLPSLMKFLEKSRIPNLKSIHDISIETGMSLKVFERFQFLEYLSLQSASTGTTALHLIFGPDSEYVELRSLKTLKIDGNAMSFCNLDLPQLTKLSIQLYGSTERSFEQTVYFKNVKCPELKHLDLHIGSLPEGFAYIANELKEYIKNVEVMSISTNSKTFATVFEDLALESLVELTLAHNEINVAPDLPHDKNENGSGDHAVQLNPKKMHFPQLELLNLFGFDKFNSSFINGDVKYPKLQTLLVLFKVCERPQKYVFKKENFPELVKLCIKYSNRYGPLKNCDICVEIEELPHLQKCYYDPNLSVTALSKSFEKKLFPMRFSQ